MRLKCLCAIAILIAAGAIEARATEGVVNRRHLACIDRADAVRFIHFFRSEEFPSFEWFLRGVESSGRCEWWESGDRVAFSDKNFGDETIEARKLPYGKPMFFDGCYIDGAKCP